jgi:hypothetical protein
MRNGRLLGWQGTHVLTEALMRAEADEVTA